MLYHASYNPAENKRYILAYNEEKHGLPRVVTSQHTTFLYRGAVNVSAVYSTTSEALKKRMGGMEQKTGYNAGWQRSDTGIFFRP